MVEHPEKQKEMTVTRNQRKWLYGLVAGFLGGMWTSVDSGMAVMLIAPKEFNLDSGLGKTLLTMAVLGVLAGTKVAVAYLKQSPLPPMEGDTELDAMKPTNHTMKILLIFTIALATLFFARPPAHGADNPTIAKLDTKETLFAAGEWTVNHFASYRVHEFGARNGKMGAGLAIGYALSRSVTLEVETLGEEYRSAPVVDSLEEAGANLKLYLLQKGGLGAYGLLGYTRNLHAEENRMNAGAGIEWRFSKHLGAFADGRWTHDFGVRDPVSLGHALFRAGLGMRF